MAKHKIFDVIQDTSGKYSATLLDEEGVGVDAADLDTVTLTLYDTATEDIVNEREEQNILNTNQVEIDTLGNLEWNWLPEDMPLLNEISRTPEVHTALFTFIWNSGASQLLHEVSFRINRVRQLA